MCQVADAWSLAHTLAQMQPTHTSAGAWLRFALTHAPADALPDLMATCRAHATLASATPQGRLYAAVSDAVAQAGPDALPSEAAVTIASALAALLPPAPGSPVSYATALYLAMPRPPPLGGASGPGYTAHDDMDALRLALALQAYLASPPVGAHYASVCTMAPYLHAPAALLAAARHMPAAGDPAWAAAFTAVDGQLASLAVVADWRAKGVAFDPVGGGMHFEEKVEHVLLNGAWPLLLQTRFGAEAEHRRATLAALFATAADADSVGLALATAARYLTPAWEIYWVRASSVLFCFVFCFGFVTCFCFPRNF